MTRKQMTAFSLDELRILRWKYLEDYPRTVAQQHQRRYILQRLDKEIHVKRLNA